MAQSAARSTASFGPRFTAGVLLLAAAVWVLWQLALALTDGFSWKSSSSRATLDPTFEEANPTKAKIIEDFTLRDRHGNPVSLHQFASVDLLVVNIWSSECQPCIEEMPSLAELDKQLSQTGRAALITIVVDEKWDDVAHISPDGTKLRILFDPEHTVTEGLFGTKRFPETFILDKQRRVRVRFDGKRDWFLPVMLDYIRSFHSPAMAAPSA